MSQDGHHDHPDHTRQGIYVCAPSGVLLASINSKDPEQVIATLQEGLAAWKRLNPAERKLSDPDLVATGRRMEAAEPVGGLILAMHVRDIPKNSDPEFRRARKWNRDTVWFSQAEAQSMVPAVLQRGYRYELPDLAVKRLAALHMIDMVNGQTEHFQLDEVVDSTIAMTVIGIRENVVELEMTGRTKTSSLEKGPNKAPRGVVTQLRGLAVYDAGKQEFVKFELVALGRRWGYTPYNFRRGPTRTNPLGFVFQLADDREPANVPASIEDYPDWVRRD